jgi:hypothetical protein
MLARTRGDSCGAFTTSFMFLIMYNRVHIHTDLTLDITFPTYNCRLRASMLARTSGVKCVPKRRKRRCRRVDKNMIKGHQ